MDTEGIEWQQRSTVLSEDNKCPWWMHLGFILHALLSTLVDFWRVIIVQTIVPAIEHPASLDPNTITHGWPEMLIKEGTHFPFRLDRGVDACGQISLRIHGHI